MTDIALDMVNEKQILLNKEIKYPAIILLGAQGVGKSTLGNMLLGCYSGANVSPIFPISDGNYEKEEEIYRTTEIMIKGINYSIIDTIGIPEGSSDEIWNKLEKVEEKATESGIKSYIFVLEGGRLTQRRLLFIQQLFTKFTKDTKKSRAIVVFTKVRKALILSNTEMEKTFNTQMSTLLHSINNRWLVMPSLELFGNDEGKSVIERFVDDLRDMIMEIEYKESVRKGIGGKRKKGISKTSRRVSNKSQNMELKKKFLYGFFVVVVFTIIIIIILITLRKLKV